jgi:hypothetical protein
MREQIHISFHHAFEPMTGVCVPDHVHLGRVTVINNQREFFEAVEDGIASYCELSLDKMQMSAQDILDLLVEIIKEDRDPVTNQPVSYAERLGFIFGKIAGLLNPDLADPSYDNLTFLQALSSKCKDSYEAVCDRDRHPLDHYFVVVAES